MPGLNRICEHNRILLEMSDDVGCYDDISLGRWEHKHSLRIRMLLEQRWRDRLWSCVEVRAARAAAAAGAQRAEGRPSSAVAPG